jgi:hypothetical protein
MPERIYCYQERQKPGTLYRLNIAAIAKTVFIG